MRLAELADALARDAAFALRQFAKRRAFTAISLLTLALGIGANAAIFSAVDAVLLHPLPVHDLERLAFLYDNLPALGLAKMPMDPAETLEMAKRSDLFTNIAGFRSADVTLTDRGEPQRLGAATTLGGFFDLFGVVPYIGRLYLPAESENGQHHVAVLSYEFWRQLRAHSAILGKPLTLNGSSFQVVGVARPGFQYPRGAQLWSPFAVNAKTQNSGRLYMNTIARLRASVTPPQLAASLAAESGRLHPHRLRQAGRFLLYY